MNIYIYAVVGMLGTFVLCIGMLLFYLKYKRNILQQAYKIKEAEVQHQKALLEASIITQEKERRRIGMNLHDEVGTALSSLRLLIENFTEQQQKPSDDQFNKQCKSSIDAVINNVRQISHDLSPVIKGRYGFQDAVLDLCDSINLSDKINVTVSFENGSNEIKLDEPVALAFYRVIAELINNTIKHANAHQINLLFSLSDGFFLIEYSDDGVGLLKNDSAKNYGMGMQNIESRLAVINAVFMIVDTTEGFKARLQRPI